MFRNTSAGWDLIMIIKLFCKASRSDAHDTLSLRLWLSEAHFIVLLPLATDEWYSPARDNHIRKVTAWHKTQIIRRLFDICLLCVWSAISILVVVE